MGRMTEDLFRHPDLAMYFPNHPVDGKHGDQPTELHKNPSPTR